MLGQQRVVDGTGAHIGFTLHDGLDVAFKRGAFLDAAVTMPQPRAAVRYRSAAVNWSPHR